MVTMPRLRAVRSQELLSRSPAWVQGSKDLGVRSEVQQPGVEPAPIKDASTTVVLPAMPQRYPPDKSLNAEKLEVKFTQQTQHSSKEKKRQLFNSRYSQVI